MNEGQIKELIHLINMHGLRAKYEDAASPGCPNEHALVLQGHGFELILGDWEGGKWFLSDTSGG